MGIRKKGTHTATFIYCSRIIFAIIISILLISCNTGKYCAAYAYQQCDELYPDYNCDIPQNPYRFANYSYSPVVYYPHTTIIHCVEVVPPSPTISNNREDNRRPSTIDGTRPRPQSTAVKTHSKRQ